MKISILIPCFNEAKFIEQCIDNIHKYSNLTNEKEIIVIDDCSTDGTRKIIEKLYNERKINDYIFKEFNEGKGAAIREGLNKVNGELVLIQDADLEYSPRDYGKLIAPFIYSNADVVYGSRFIGSEKRRVLYFWHSVGNFILTMFSNMLSNLNLTDMENCYKVFKSDVIKKINIEENRFGFEPEITAKIAKKNLKIYEVSVNYYGRKYSEGKKITWKDGFSAIRCIIKYNIF